MQPKVLSTDEYETLHPTEQKIMADMGTEVAETHHGIPVEEPKKKELPARGRLLNLDGIPMVVLSKSDRLGTLHLRILTDREIANIIRAQEEKKRNYIQHNLTDEDLARIIESGTKSTEELTKE